MFISVKNLKKIYRIGTNKVRALDGVSFEIERGEFCAIVGTSGSGKSTLLNMMAGLEPPTKGSVVIKQKITGMSNELVRFHVNKSVSSSVLQFIAILNSSGKRCAAANFSGMQRDGRSGRSVPETRRSAKTHAA